ncbi:Site-specific recombinase [Cupriavidus necator]|uniref:Recombinase n=1 Tax=Cupriavidus necator (strain ATCC 17699 / DSM 428 / KCTC 22496 / NCIMB 10442 / H16 / Stanier 337) TaxID=381666 RepID=Q0KCH4_CUPNH|nr:site-specific recombinase [Cupriavidus necator]QCC00197.1 recombinase [Cupriavidus necator H16]QQB76988.1 site-specific recombinase [Cupriavidus necator]WKA42051.1 site-specific recombinase [Cupriavidus necator]CAJ92297.1 Site-specific recombinase [Cupriavidus necator H16]
MLRKLFRKWRESRNASLQLDAILAAADPEAPLAERNGWLIELGFWIRRDGGLGADTDSQEPGTDRRHPEHVRLRYLLQVLERHPDWAGRFALTVRSLVRENDPTGLFCDTGVALHPGFVSEMVGRLQNRFLPPPPNRSDMAGLFALVFVGDEDAEWVEAIDDGLLARLARVLQAGSAGGEAAGMAHYRDALGQTLATSIAVLVSQVRATGLSQAIRSRLAGRVEETPFFRLDEAIQALREEGLRHDDNSFGHRLNYFRALLDGCHAAIRQVYEDLEENGVSVEVVFQIERMKVQLSRIELLLAAWVEPRRPGMHAHLVAELIRSTQARRSISHLAGTSFAQLARKVVERSAETGEHYITRDRKEYAELVRAAAGGGLVSVATVYLKFLIYGLHLDKFSEGLLASLNYAGSFLAIHFAHFTLATKQPAMTGPALAHRLDGAGRPEGREIFVDDTIAMIRSNAAAIVGNLAVVFPVALGIQWLAHKLLGANLITPAKAIATIESFSILGPTPLYAAFTGVLLWLSSLIAGWADNWFALHRVHDVMAYNRRLQYVLGARGATRLADFWKRNLSGIAANVSLGLLLGLGPEILSFFGPHMEVRHVTLSTGSVGAAIGVLGLDALRMPSLWLAVAGIALMGMLNVAVSFALAFNMALRSRNLRRVDRAELSAAVRRRILKHPLSLVIPPRAAGPETAAGGREA